MNFEGFKDLVRRVSKEWLLLAKKEILEMELVQQYLAQSPFSAPQTPDNELAYERLMDVRMKLYELSYEIDKNHDAYMEFMQQCLDSPDLMDNVCQGLLVEEKHLIHLELMIMEQVADWEIGTGRADQPESAWTKANKLVVCLPDGTTRTISVSKEVDQRYWFGICPVSHKIGNLKLCGGCHMVGYVGKDEQKEDWPKHKAVCEIWQKFVRGRGLNADQIMSILMEKLGRRTLTQYEMDMANFPRVCSVCMSDCSGHVDDLKTCKSCFCVAFCSEHFDQGRRSHEPFCKHLRTAAEDYKNEKTLGHQVQNYMPTAKTRYQPLPADVEVFFSTDVAALVSNKVPGYQESQLRQLSFWYTCPLTVLFGAQAAGVVGPDTQKLTVHLVGVRVAEFRHLVCWELLAFQLPKLNQLTLVFIGDECPAGAGNFPKDFTYKSKNLQQDDLRKDLCIRYQVYPMLYQDYWRLNSRTKPDLVVALDCGFKFYPTWQGAISLMLQHKGVPLIFTDFNLADTEDNQRLVQRLVEGVQVCLPPQRNPFSSLRPFRCSDRSGNYTPNSVIFTNDYICVMMC